MTADSPPLVAPFVGEHFAALDRLSDLLAPPYDVIAEAERAALARQRHNIVHLILPQGDGDRYGNAAALLSAWRRDGVLVRGRAPAVYVVQQEFTVPDGRTLVRTGLVGAVAAEPFGAGRVRPHERTHAGPKQDRLALLRATHAMFESLLMLARDPGGDLARSLTAVAQGAAPWAVGQVRGNAVRVWRVEGQAARQLAQSAGRGSLYIADGHHRFETAVAFRAEFPAAERTLALTASLSDPGLVVLSTHRIIHGQPFTNEILDGLAARCRLEEHQGGDPGTALTRVRSAGGGCGLVLNGGRILVLTRRPGADPQPLAPFHPAVRQLDVTWADAYVVAALRGASGGQLGYSSDTAEVMADVRAGRAVAGVLLNPPAVSDVLDVADAGGFMPQKSTYFLPKVPSGLVMLPYDGW